MQIQAAHIKGQFSPQHVEKTLNMVSRLGQRVRNQVDPLIVLLRKSFRTTFVARMKKIGIHFRLLRQESPQQEFVSFF